MEDKTRDRVGGAIGFLAVSVVGTTWLAAGLWRESWGWQVLFWVPLLLILLDYGFMMVGKERLFARVKRVPKKPSL